jgi:hypothetical protein
MKSLWKKGAVGLLFILLLSGCQLLKSKEDLYILVFEEVNGLQIKTSHGDFRDQEAFLAFPVPISYQLDRSEYRLTIELTKNYTMQSRFQIKAINKLTNENYVIKTAWLPGHSCFTFYEIKGNTEFLWKAWGNVYKETNCKGMDKSGRTLSEDFQLYNKKKELVATEKLYFHFVKNGHYLYK